MIRPAAAHGNSHPVMFMNHTDTCLWKRLLPAILLTILSSSVFCFCKKTEDDAARHETDALRQVLYVQSLYNNHPGEDIVPIMGAVIDSMKIAGRNPYYFAANNILIDRLFSDGRFSEADSLAVVMEDEARQDGDSVSIAMARRVRAQMYYKLFQPELALRELGQTESFIANPYRSVSDFGTATSIQEWLWIVSRQIGDTAGMGHAARKYAGMVEENRRLNHWDDSTGHYLVTAMAFKAHDAFLKGEIGMARELLDSASSRMIPSLPARAYEHLYEVRCKVRSHDADWNAAIADVDTLLNTHKDFPWFYVKDLLMRAEVLNLAGRHEESNDAFSRYIEFHDSLSSNITEKRLHDLTILYRSELDEEQQRVAGFRTIALCSAIAFLLILLGVAYFHGRREKKRNQHLVKRLMELDVTFKTEDKEEKLSPIECLDHYMAAERPYTDPTLGRKELADFMKMPQGDLGELIKRERGVSVHAYINAFRLEEARKILGSASAEGIAEMADRLGFGTSRTLQRAFRERYDMSPTQYRNAAREIL